MPTGPSEAPALLELRPGAGLTARVDLEVAPADTALAHRSGDVPVLSTPRLLALCEEASCRVLDGRLGAGQTSVATRARFDHLAPVPVGATVRAEATLERVEGRRLLFTLSASTQSAERAGLVGAGRLTRVLVDRRAFLAKVGVEETAASGSGGTASPKAGKAAPRSGKAASRSGKGTGGTR